MTQQNEITESLLEAIKGFPATRDFEHCGTGQKVSSFAIYARCNVCGTEVKTRSFSGVFELEDVFDAVFEWMTNPTNRSVAEERIQAIRIEKEE